MMIRVTGPGIGARGCSRRHNPCCRAGDSRRDGFLRDGASGAGAAHTAGLTPSTGFLVPPDAFATGFFGMARPVQAPPTRPG